MTDYAPVQVAQSMRVDDATLVRETAARSHARLTDLLASAVSDDDDDDDNSSLRPLNTGAQTSAVWDIPEIAYGEDAPREDGRLSSTSTSIHEPPWLDNLLARVRRMHGDTRYQFIEMVAGVINMPVERLYDTSEVAGTALVRARISQALALEAKMRDARVDTLTAQHMEYMKDDRQQYLALIEQLERVDETRRQIAQAFEIQTAEDEAREALGTSILDEVRSEKRYQRTPVMETTRLKLGEAIAFDELMLRVARDIRNAIVNVYVKRDNESAGGVNDGDKAVRVDNALKYYDFVDALNTALSTDSVDQTKRRQALDLVRMGDDAFASNIAELADFARGTGRRGATLRGDLAYLFAGLLKRRPDKTKATLEAVFDNADDTSAVERVFPTRAYGEDIDAKVQAIAVSLHVRRGGWLSRLEERIQLLWASNNTVPSMTAQWQYGASNAAIERRRLTILTSVERARREIERVRERESDDIFVDDPIEHALIRAEVPETIAKDAVKSIRESIELVDDPIIKAGDKTMFSQWNVENSLAEIEALVNAEDELTTRPREALLVKFDRVDASLDARKKALQDEVDDVLTQPSRLDLTPSSRDWIMKPEISGVVRVNERTMAAMRAVMTAVREKVPQLQDFGGANGNDLDDLLLTTGDARTHLATLVGLEMAEAVVANNTRVMSRQTISRNGKRRRKSMAALRTRAQRSRATGRVEIVSAGSIMFEGQLAADWTSMATSSVPMNRRYRRLDGVPQLSLPQVYANAVAADGNSQASRGDYASGQVNLSIRGGTW